ncbi:MAG: hypothetical protein WAX77_08530 [Methylococcaceae bacterium]
MKYKLIMGIVLMSLASYAFSADAPTSSSSSSTSAPAPAPIIDYCRIHTC